MPGLAAGLGNASTFLDSVAFGVSVANVPIALAVCGATTELGCIEFAIATYGIGQGIEAGISWTSTGLTATSDFLSGESGYDPNRHALVVGQDTFFSFTSSVAGSLLVDPYGDGVVNSAVVAYDYARTSNNLGNNMALVIPLP